MPSTLTAGDEDGKQSKKIERNTRKAVFSEILFLIWLYLFAGIARTNRRAQSLLEGLQPEIKAGKPQ
ncbi:MULTISPECIES: hypothetical protein [Pseudomonas]|uniref:hypothetical protein n=1 Tax=Pseudomonas TaxID=286 RepID=UPI00191DB089|nr:MULTISPECIES: hypothetical protein [Pseudomonas]MBL0794189.1 hypothetical protein [Pseudomonas sp. B7]MBX8623029.1 hypothetical protein [Pseudomonas glycinae]